MENELFYEVILVMNLNVESEVIIYYIVDMCKIYNVKVICIVYGVLMGGLFEMVDGSIFLYFIIGCWDIIF